MNSCTGFSPLYLRRIAEPTPFDIFANAPDISMFSINQKIFGRVLHHFAGIDGNWDF